MPLNLSLSMASLMLCDLHRGLKMFKFKPTIAFNFYESRSRIFPSGPESSRTCLLGSLQGTLVHGPVHSPPLSFLLFPFTLTFPSASWKTPWHPIYHFYFPHVLMLPCKPQPFYVLPPSFLTFNKGCTSWVEFYKYSLGFPLVLPTLRI